MQKYYILGAFALILNLSSVKAEVRRDSIGVENLNGKKLVLHQIVAKDTYYSIGRRYNVSPKTIMTYNDNKFLSLGVVIKVPTEVPFTAVPVPSAASTKTAAAAINKVLPAAEVKEGITIIEHAVQRKENLNMLAEKYGTTVNAIKELSNLRSINLQIGQVLKIPATKGIEAENTQTVNTAPVNSPPVVATVTTQVSSQYKKPDTIKKSEVKPGKTITVTPATAGPPAKDQLVVHIVAGNETMYSIASKYNLTMDQLKAKNNLTTNSLYVGQKLLINGQYPVGRETTEASEEADSLESVKNPSLRLPASRYGLSQMDEKGTGIWILDPDLDASKMLVLHRSAPVGTIMKITNPMSNRSTFAKVVGKFTENESTKDVIIVMTKAVADALGALDKRFLCNLTYSGQANEQ
jgi:peptidoglycan endopeptidase LytF